MSNLITRTDIALYGQISKNVPDAVINPIIQEAQFMDLMPLLGEKLYNAVIATPEDFTDLINGSTYTHSGVSYKNYGLKAVLSSYFLARYAMFGDITDVAGGMVNKLNNAESQPINYGFKKNIYQAKRDVAFNYWQSVEAFLIRTNNPIFERCQRKTNFRISKIS